MRSLLLLTALAAVAVVPAPAGSPGPGLEDALLSAGPDDRLAVVVMMEAFPVRDTLLADFMAERGVAYAIILLDWFPDLAARDDVLEEVYRVTLERNTIVGGETMVVYQADW